MRTIQEIKIMLDHLYEFNVMKKTRIRKYSYARKILTTLASNHGHTNEAIESVLGIKHDIVIYNHKTIDTINKVDMVNYNRCIDKLNLKMNKIISLNSLSDNPVAEGIYIKLKSLGRKDLAYFNSQVFEPFLKKIEFEKSIKDL
tara:strand:+ start:793 stop:1224 length:432 start_codon:yes stop_codon:yes gene_type:complete